MATRNQLVATELPSPGTVAVNIAKSVVSSPKVMSAMSLWVFGIFVCLYAAAPFPTTDEDRALFSQVSHVPRPILFSSRPRPESTPHQSNTQQRALDYHCEN
jgi:hypothetical protein